MHGRSATPTTRALQHENATPAGSSDFVRQTHGEPNEAGQRSNVVKPSGAVKLVGIWLDEKLIFKQQAAVAVAKGQEWMVNSRRLRHIVGGADIQQLYLAICVPRMLYGVEVWLVPVYQQDQGANRQKDTCALVRKLTSIQLKAARLMVGGHQEIGAFWRSPAVHQIPRCCYQALKYRSPLPSPPTPVTISSPVLNSEYSKATYIYTSVGFICATSEGAR
ncbi:hypothetical protein DFH08DRAFT_811643 [Mycena albidolilacea]|uniref:Reverse transcriptase domain-containing protein n=1 Tax=Mycena albidolilacea TaxID=1033008 RepID=A0AAD7EN39_9AGAR|nr:hypothetical protein DFH08DRAFT_811643 [Mycena albidolilacea]